MKRSLSISLLSLLFVIYTPQLFAQPASLCLTSSSDNVIRTGSFTSSIAVRDFNSDGIPDIVASNTGSQTVSIVLGRGERSFSAPETIDSFDCFQVISEDLNNDDKYDLAVSDTQGGIMIYLGDGTGKFQKHTTQLAQVAGKVYVLKAGDFDGDNNLDLVTSGISFVQVVYGDGTGGFGEPVDVTDQRGVEYIVCADFNSDDITDIALPDDGKLYIYNTNGSTELTEHEIMDLNGPPAMIGADFNSDGKQDILLRDAYKLFLGNGALGFPNSYDIPQVIADGTMVVDDLNNDDVLDFASISKHSGLPILYGITPTTFEEHISVYAGGSPADLSSNDMDGDGKVDLVIAQNDATAGGVLVLYNEGDHFTTSESYFAGAFQWSMMVEDINDDGRKDIAISNYFENHVSIMMQSSDGTFEMITPATIDIDNGNMIPGDYNSDGNMDIATNAPGSRVNLFYGDGEGAFTAGPTYSYNIDDMTGGDFNNDGKPDLAARLKSTNFITVLLGDGAGNFAKTDYNAGVFGVTIHTGDFDHDGKTDIATIAENDNHISVLFGNGDGTFDAPTSMNTGDALRNINYPVDIDGDGKTDFVTMDKHGTYPGFTVFMNEGDEFTPIHTELDYRLNAVSHGDYNGDGIIDLLIGGQGSGNVSIYIGLGDGHFNSPLYFPTGTIWLLNGSDLDNDGSDDIVAAQAVGEMVVVLRNNTATIKQIGTIAACDETVDLVASNNGYNYQWVTPTGNASGQTITAGIRGTYTLIVSNASEQCKTSTEITIDGNPAPPMVDIVNPTCLQPLGVLTVDSENIEDTYSFDNGSTFQPATFKSLAPGEYKVVTKSSAGCTSDARTVTIDPQPTYPEKPIVETSDPTCTDPTGTISVIVQKAGDAYSFDNGETYSGLNANDEMAPGVYHVVIRRSIDCISDSTQVTIHTGPAIPGKPTLTATSNGGSVTLQSSEGTAYIWLKDDIEIATATSQSYEASETGAYSVIVLSQDGCRSESSLPYNAVITGDINDLVIGFYPNPADSYIYFKTESSSIQSMIYTSGGKQIDVTPAYSGDRLVYDVTNFSAGVYLLKIIIDGRSQTIRWVKK